MSSVPDQPETTELSPETTGPRVCSRRDLRSLAFQLLYAVDRLDYAVSVEEIAEQYQDYFEVAIPEDSYAIELARGAIDNRDELDERIKPLLKNWSLERLGCCTLLIIRMALWELGQPEAVANIVINEAIELAKCFAEKDAYKFVNGLLDTLYKAK